MLRTPMIGCLGAALCIGCLIQIPARGQITEFNGVEVPGVVVAHIAASNDYKYNSPSLAIMPNGDYYISHDVTGNNAPWPRPTYVYRSTDQGQSWSQISTVNNLIWANLYASGNDLYLMGRGSGFVVLKSTDGGVTWSNPTSSTTGLIAPNYSGYSWHTAPVTVVEHDGRLWRGVESRQTGVSGSSAGVMSIPIGADLLDASNWTFSNRIHNQTGWLPDDDFRDWIEGNVVVDRDGNLTNIMRVGVPRGSDEVAAIMRVSDPSTITFDPRNDIIDFNGGAKKFTIRYDATTDRYWSLANIITPFNTDTSILPSSHRDILALVQSRDMENWDVERIVVQDLSDQANIGFQYVDWLFEGDDMVAASRTAYPDGLDGALNFHDANFITFHRFEDFANKSPTQALVADTNNNRVMRYELTETDKWMPVGKFELGSSFDGASLNKPMGLAQDGAGNVYIGEQADGGRLMRFDLSGNFLGVVATEGVDFSGRPEALTMGPDGNLYMSVAFGANSDKVYKIDAGTGNVSEFISTNFSGGTLDNSRSIAFGDDGNLYVADRENDVFRRFDGDSGAYLGDLYSADGPEGLAWDEFQNKLIAAYLDGGDANLVELGTSGGAGTLYNVSDVGRCLGIVEIDGDIFWSDWDNGKVYKLKGTNEISTSVSGLNGPGHLLEIDPMPVGVRSWTQSGSGDWRDWDHWTYWSRPDTSDEVAFFGSSIGSTATVNVDNDYTIKGLRFNNDNRYILSGSGSLTLEAYSGNALIDVQKGTHWIGVGVTLNNDVDLDLTGAGTSLVFYESIDLNGNTLFKTGVGSLDFEHGMVMNGGCLKTDGLDAIVFSSPSAGQLDLNGDFVFTPDTSLSLEFGEAFDLLDGLAYLDGETFDNLILPDLDSFLLWDTDTFYSDGIVRISAHFPGDANIDGACNVIDLGILASNYRQSGSWEQGDFDGDGDVDVGDLGILATAYGTEYLDSPVGSAATPEPGALSLLGVGGLVLLVRRRRK